MWRIAETSAALDRQTRRGKKIVELKFIPVLRKRFKKAFTKIKATITKLRNTSPDNKAIPPQKKTF